MGQEVAKEEWYDKLDREELMGRTAKLKIEEEPVRRGWLTKNS